MKPGDKGLTSTQWSTWSRVQAVTLDLGDGKTLNMPHVNGSWRARQWITDPPEVFDGVVSTKPMSTVQVIEFEVRAYATPDGNQVILSCEVNE